VHARILHRLFQPFWPASPITQRPGAASSGLGGAKVWLPVSFDARRILSVFAGFTMRISASFATSIENRVMSLAMFAVSSLVTDFTVF